MKYFTVVRLHRYTRFMDAMIWKSGFISSDSMPGFMVESRELKQGDGKR